MRFRAKRKYHETDPFGIRFGNDFVSAHLARGRAGGALISIVRERGVIFLISVFAVAFALLIFAYGARADNSYLTPTSCLGGWQYSANAEGQPDHAEGTGADEFSAIDSAVLPRGTSGSIFCGKFSGSIPENTQPVRAALRLSWTVRGTPAPQVISGESFSEEVAAQAAALPENIGGEFTFTDQTKSGSSDEAQDDTKGETEPAEKESAADSAELQTSNEPSSTEEPASAVTPVEEVSAPANEEVPQSEPPASPSPLPTPPSEEPTSFRSFFFPNAYAADEVPVEDAETPAEEIESSVEAGVSESVNASSTNEKEVTAGDGADDAKEKLFVASVEPFSDEPFVQVSISIDGESWHTLGTFSPKQIPGDRIEVPRTVFGGWEDLVNAQVRIERLTTVNDMPEVFLDGMALDVEYEDLSQGEETVLGQRVEKVPFNPEAEIIERVIAWEGVAVVLTRPANDSSERRLWLIDLSSRAEAYLFAKTEAILPETPLAMREEVALWQAQDGQVYGFRLQSRRYLTGEERQSDVDGERRFSLRGIDAEVLLRAGAFFFADATRGEIASDDDGALHERFVELYFEGIRRDREDLIETNLVPPPDPTPIE